MRPGGSSHSTRKVAPDKKQDPRVPSRTEPGAPAEFTEPDPPASLGESGRAAWSILWALGGPTGVYSVRADAFVIERYASLVDRRTELERTLKAEGWIAAGSQGQEIIHPAARLLQQAEADMLKLEDRLGLNPTARFSLEGLALGVEETKSKLESFLGGR